MTLGGQYNYCFHIRGREAVQPAQVLQVDSFRTAAGSGWLTLEGESWDRYYTARCPHLPWLGSHRASSTSEDGSYGGQPENSGTYHSPLSNPHFLIHVLFNFTVDLEPTQLSENVLKVLMHSWCWLNLTVDNLVLKLFPFEVLNIYLK